ncbi:peptidase propeptide domain-containing protein [Clostridium saccharoperbutylacetonicum]|uniref:peptidase propeptide domain-containing protein n=1 Tax=Clostridium saccharoperbutylacetonicum TaxID=36745 RepID=UPI0039ED0D16
MKLKKASIIVSLIILCLLVIVGIILYNFIGPGSKDIKASKEFISKLYSINAISNEFSLESIKYERGRVLNNDKKMVSKSIVTQNYGIDLDKNNNVIGFTKKEIPVNTTKINLKDATILADSYIKKIYDGEVILKSINDNMDESTLPYYSFVYTKQKNGYAFYFDEIKVNIDKENGFLDGYSNSTMQKESKEATINISEEKARKIALETFEKYNNSGEARNNVELVYANNRIDKKENQIYEVCYIVTTDGKNDKGSYISWKIFVSAENGTILNILKDGAEEEVVTN